MQGAKEGWQSGGKKKPPPSIADWMGGRKRPGDPPRRKPMPDRLPDKPMPGKPNFPDKWKPMPGRPKPKPSPWDRFKDRRKKAVPYTHARAAIGKAGNQ